MNTQEVDHSKLSTYSYYLYSTCINIVIMFALWCNSWLQFICFQTRIVSDKMTKTVMFLVLVLHFYKGLEGNFILK